MTWKSGGMHGYFNTPSSDQSAHLSLFLLHRYWMDTRKEGNPEELMTSFDGTWDPASTGCELVRGGIWDMRHN